MSKRITIVLEKVILKKLHNFRANKIKQVNKPGNPSEENPATMVKSQSWIQTPLRDFGYKCIENEHELCKGCKCLCHFGDTRLINQNS